MYIKYNKMQSKAFWKLSIRQRKINLILIIYKIYMYKTSSQLTLNRYSINISTDTWFTLDRQLVEHWRSHNWLICIDFHMDGMPVKINSGQLASYKSYERGTFLQLKYNKTSLVAH